MKSKSLKVMARELGTTEEAVRDALRYHGFHTALADAERAVYAPDDDDADSRKGRTQTKWRPWGNDDVADSSPWGKAAT